jgi:hypothetical protein
MPGLRGPRVWRWIAPCNLYFTNYGDNRLLKLPVR